MSQEPITEPTPFEKAVASAAAVNGHWYFDEYLYRGEPNGQNGGQYKGSHVVVGIRYVDQFGDVQTKLFPPMPVGDLPGQVPLSLIFPEAAVALQRGLDAANTKIAELETTIAGKNLTIEAKQASIDELANDLHAASTKLANVAHAIA